MYLVLEGNCILLREFLKLQVALSLKQDSHLHRQQIFTKQPILQSCLVGTEEEVLTNEILALKRYWKNTVHAHWGA